MRSGGWRRRKSDDIRTEEAGDDDEMIDCACSSLVFSGDEKNRTLVCATNEGEVLILNIDEEGNDIIVKNVLPVPEQFEADDQPCPVSKLSLSPDGRWLACGRNARLTGAIVIYDLNNLAGVNIGEDNVWWALPNLEAAHSCLRFFSGKNSTANKLAALAVGCTNNSFYVFDVPNRRLSEWTHDAGLPVHKSLPRDLVGRPEYPVTIAFDPLEGNQFLLVSK